MLQSNQPVEKMKTKSRLISIALSSLAALSVTSCVMYSEPPPARSVEYGTFSCDGSEQFVAQFQDEGTKVALMMDKRTRVLERDVSGVYSDSTYSLTGSETTPITVFKDGIPFLRNCVPVTTQKQYYRKDDKFRVLDIHRDLEH